MLVKLNVVGLCHDKLSHCTHC